MTRWQKIRLSVIAIAALGIIAMWIAIRPEEHKLRLIACFEDVHGLQAGADVQISGVDVGHATSVQAHPEMKDCTAEVKMILQTPYPLAIPSDAIARIETGGLLGPALVSIDVHGATGPPAGDSARVKTAPMTPPLDALRALVDAANEKCAKCESQLQKSRPATKP
jgi:ABC-type transporter Mla subunit MlaD